MDEILKSEFKSLLKFIKWCAQTENASAKSTEFLLFHSCFHFRSKCFEMKKNILTDIKVMFLHSYKIFRIVPFVPFLHSQKKKKKATQERCINQFTSDLSQFTEVSGRDFLPDNSQKRQQAFSTYCPVYDFQRKAPTGWILLMPPICLPLQNIKAHNSSLLPL